MKILPLNNRMLIKISGKDRLEFLQGLITVDIYQLKLDNALWSGLLSPQGKALFDFFIYDNIHDSVLIDINTVCGDNFINHIQKYILRSDVSIEKNTNLTVTAIWEHSEISLNLDKGYLIQDPRLEKMGCRYIADSQQQQDFVTQHTDSLSDNDDYKNLRIECQIVDPAEEMQDMDYYWPEINAEFFNGVDYKKGCYVGQEVTARLKHKADLKNKIVPVYVMGNPETPIKMATDIQDIGTLLCVDSWTGKGLAYVRVDRWNYAVETLRSVTAGMAMIMKAE